MVLYVLQSLHMCVYMCVRVCGAYLWRAACVCAGSWWPASWWRPCPGGSWHCGAEAAGGPARRKPPSPCCACSAPRPATSPYAAPSCSCQEKNKHPPQENPQKTEKRLVRRENCWFAEIQTLFGSIWISWSIFIWYDEYNSTLSVYTVAKHYYSQQWASHVTWQLIYHCKRGVIYLELWYFLWYDTIWHFMQSHLKRSSPKRQSTNPWKEKAKKLISMCSPTGDKTHATYANVCILCYVLLQHCDELMSTETSRYSCYFQNYASTTFTKEVQLFDHGLASSLVSSSLSHPVCHSDAVSWTQVNVIVGNCLLCMSHSSLSLLSVCWT